MSTYTVKCRDAKGTHAFEVKADNAQAASAKAVAKGYQVLEIAERAAKSEPKAEAKPEIKPELRPSPAAVTASAGTDATPAGAFNTDAIGDVVYAMLQYPGIRKKAEGIIYRAVAKGVFFGVLALALLPAALWALLAALGTALKR